MNGKYITVTIDKPLTLSAEITADKPLTDRITESAVDCQSVSDKQ